MAGERLGQAYEVLVRYALEQVRDKRPAVGDIYEQTPPTGFSIKTDFTLGPTPDSPAFLIQVTHSGSKKDSSRKFWRNIAELFETRLLLRECSVIGVYFSSELLKKDMVAIQRSVLDDLYIVPDESFFSNLSSLAARISSGSKSVSLSRVRLTPTEKSALVKFTASLDRCLIRSAKLSRSAFDDARRAFAARPALTAKFRQSSFVRGMSKLLLFPSPEVAFECIIARKSLPSELLPPKESCLTRPSLRGSFVVDPDLNWLTANMDFRTVTSILKHPDIGVLEKYLVVLRDLGQVKDQLRWMHSNWHQLSSARGMFQSLRMNHTQPTLGSIENHYSWLYYLLIEALKQAAGTRQGFGLSRLLATITSNRTAPDYHQRLERITGGSEIKLRAVRSVERLISVQLFDRRSPGSPQLFERYTTDMAEIAVALSGLISEVGKELVSPERESQYRAGLFQLQYECNIASPKGFDFTTALLEFAADQAGVTLRRSNVRGGWIERAIAEGANLRADSGVTELLCVGHWVFHGQSVTKKGRDHKRKELAARAVGLRFSWDAGKRRYVRRPGVNRLVLLVDGEWDAPSLSILKRAGWDDFVLPDELGQLEQLLKTASKG